MMGSFFLAPVHGNAAIMTGFGDIFLAIFAFFRPDSGRRKVALYGTESGAN